MYRNGEDISKMEEIPFVVMCTNCGSHDVDVIAFEHWDLEIKCRLCGSCLDVGKYNETRYSMGV